MIFFNPKLLVRHINNYKISNIVLCHGVFDLVHVGHIKYFNEAKKNGDYLIVSVTSDKFIKKGPGRPLFNESLRMEYLSNIKNIDAVVLSDHASAVEVIKHIKPKFYIKGPDYKINKSDKTKKIYLEKKEVEKHGGEIKYTSNITFSSTKLINSQNLIFDNKQTNFIKKIKKKYNLTKIINLLKPIKKLRVLVVGEIVIDEYNFGDIIGKSGKEPHLVLKESFKESYAGGSAAVARHISSFVKSAKVISFFGNEKKNIEILKQQSDVKIKYDLFKPYSKFDTIVKKRFIDLKSNYKLFGSYILPNLHKTLFNNQLLQKIKKNLSKFDLIIVCDYGHGLLSNETIKHLNKIKKFLSLNIQLNSSNIGTHTLNKYNNVDILIINESELRFELKNEYENIKTVAKKYFKNRKLKNLVITRGLSGALLVDKKKIYECPAFAFKSIDKVGAGDAMLSIISLCLKNNIDKDLSLFLGSLAAAFSVQSIGNKKIFNFSEMENFLKYSLR
tara:strand:- start:8672 stop:10177 length:1506 start_codon:yes stop_codon:yes gene_type:complete